MLSKNLASGQEDKFQFYSRSLKLGPTFHFVFYLFCLALKMSKLVHMCYDDKAVGHRTYLTEEILRDIENKYNERKKAEEREQMLLKKKKEENGGVYPEYLSNYLENHPYIMG